MTVATSLAASDPDRAASILQALTESVDKDDRDTAAIYVKYLFATRAEHAREILLTLLQDPDDEVCSKALDTLDIVTDDNQLSAVEAARMANNTHRS